MNPIITLASIDLIMQGIGIPLDIYIVLIITIGSLILSAKSIKIGLALTLLLYAMAYTTFRMVAMPTDFALYGIFGALILMTLSIYTTKSGDIV